MTRITPLRLILLAALLATVAVGFVVVPTGTSLPVHWDTAGEADSFAPREVALLLPLGAVGLVWAILFAVERFVTPAARQAGAYVMGAAMTAVTGLFLAVAATTVAIGAGVAVSMVQVVAAAIGVLLVVLGNAMPKSRPNGHAGIRIPTTLRSERNWQATHRAGGLLMMAGGAVLLGAALLVPTSMLFWWLLGCVLVPIAITLGYSIALARRGV